MVVEKELQTMGFHPLEVTLGAVTLENSLQSKDKQTINTRLYELGFELIDNKQDLWVTQIKTLLIQWVHLQVEKSPLKLSEYLQQHLLVDYTTLSRTFSQLEGLSIEQYYILQKIEKVKELLSYNQMSLGEMSAILQYSSVAHLSAQFKKTTGLTPSQYKKQLVKARSPLDKL
jgi:AraC-like DNA-binding protein